jgi:hypothetical protein
VQAVPGTFRVVTNVPGARKVCRDQTGSRGRGCSLLYLSLPVDIASPNLWLQPAHYYPTWTTARLQLNLHPQSAMLETSIRK